MASDRNAARDDDTMVMRTAASGDTQSIPSLPGPAEDGIAGLMPMLDDPRRRFDTVMRGYDRHQVDTYVAKLEDDNRVLASGRSETSTRVSDLAAQLASAQAEIESLRRRVAAAVETIDPDNVDSRVQEVVALAQQVARQTRTDAEADAQRIRASATAAADTLKAESRTEADQVVAAATQRLAEADETYTRKIGEADQRAAELTSRAEEELRLARTEVATLRDTTNVEVATLRTTAAEEIAEAASAASAARTEADRVSRESRESADGQAAAKRAQAEEDFEITLRLRRRREEEEDRERRATALREATAIVTDANNTADRIVRDARHEVQRLDHERQRVHAELEVIAGRVAGVVADHDPADNPLAVQ